MADGLGKGLSSSLTWLNSLPSNEAAAAMLRCCGSREFAELAAKARPFFSIESAKQASRDIWWNQVSVTGWLEAFKAHPRIGDIEGLRKKFASTADLCEGEQSAALSSSDETILRELAEWNGLYETRFGHVFLVCASGRSSAQILCDLKARYSNRPLEELRLAAAEQQKITELRLAKLLSAQEIGQVGTLPGGGLPNGGGLGVTGQPASVAANEMKAFHQLAGAIPLERRLAQIEHHLSSPLHPLPPVEQPQALTLRPSDERADLASTHRGLPPVTPAMITCSPAAGPANTCRPPITTHVLDVALGKPAAGVGVNLEKLQRPSPAGAGPGGELWTAIGSSQTDGDGRSGPLMAASAFVEAGTYRLTFGTGDYFTRTLGGRAAGFYPFVTVVFHVKEEETSEHFHVPVLLAPYSFSTYRGS